MTISPLADETIRVFTSAVVLHDATSVVKELLENALDARATSIAVEISANTLDTIQVKDNGIGIGVEDRQLLCKRGCTSKIQTLEDLEKLCGTFLGFRGEALASTAGLSESVVITTRVDGEVVGSTLKFGPSGSLLSSASASHPVGTTVRVQSFLSSVPVRKQVVLKTTTRILGDIKKVLYSYAFARPTIRFTLKVLKNKNEKANWSFAPCSSADQMSSVAAKIVGTDVALLCRQHSLSQMIQEEASEKPTYTINALILDHQNPAISNVGNVGQYISIDGRPVSVERSTCKELVKLYKVHLDHAVGDGRSITTKPFLCFNLRCPEGTYDVNIEPAKDEVAFHEPTIVLDLARKLFSQCYGDIEIAAKQKSRTDSRPNELATSSFDILLARKQSPRSSNLPGKTTSVVTDNRPISVSPGNDTTSISQIETAESTDKGIQSTQTPQRTHRNMFTIDDDMVIEPQNDDLLLEQEEDVEDLNSNVLLNNPFTSAKLHARLSPQKLSGVSENEAPTFRSHKLDADKDTMEDRVSSSPARLTTTIPGVLSHRRSYLPTPTKSPALHQPYQNPGPPLRRKAYRVEDTDDSDLSGEDEHVPHNVSHGKPGLLQAWAKPKQWAVSPEDSRASNSRDGDNATADARTNLLANLQDKQNPLHKQINVSPPVYGQTPLANKPFRSPLKQQPSTITSHPPTDGPNKKNIMKGLSQSNRASVDSATQSSELEHIMDFEHRKKAINMYRKSQQSRLNPADLAQLQTESLRKAPPPNTGATSPISQSESNHVPLSQTNFASKFATSSDSVSEHQKSSPHHNRFLAATRRLDDAKDNNSTPTSNMGQPQLSILSNQRHEPQHQKPLFSKAGSNIQAITLNIPPDTASKPKAKRTKSLRLPLETIPKEAIKHNILAVPSAPFSSTDKLSSHFCDLKACDQYIQTGKNDYIQWSPYSTHVSAWETKTKDLISSSYRAGPYERDEESETAAAKPVLEISLVKAIKAHIEILSPNEPSL